MDLRDINNYFGDMDLFLMDFILKGKIPENARVLDVGCGEGRNSLYFIQQGYDYTGIDSDASKISLIEYLTQQSGQGRTVFLNEDLSEFTSGKPFDFIICSRMLHFSEDEQMFHTSIQKLCDLLGSGGLLYIAMDSVFDTVIKYSVENGPVVFPDGKIRFPLTKDRYNRMLDFFLEEEPPRTIIHHGKRAQSFLLLRRN